MGLGYIGLPTAAMFATHGHEVIGVDVNRRVIDALNQGHIVIEEPDLGGLVSKAVSAGTLKGSTSPELADVFIVSVPTPFKQDKTADMSYVVAATEAIVPFLRRGNTVVLESTSPPGTVEELMIPILRKSGLTPGQDLFVAHSPERVLPGRILIELVENDRIVGGINAKSAEQVKQLYMSFVRGNIYTTDATTAEMCKVMENTFRDVNIALANELAKLCERFGINVWEVIQLCNKHPRVNLHQPGPGVGGHCLAVDPWFIVEKAPDLAQIIGLSRRTNDAMPHYVADRIMKLVASSPMPPKVTIFGATYKPDIDDMRESPILELIEVLENKGVRVSLVDPHISCHECLEPDIDDAVRGSDVLVLAVNHREFRSPDFSRIVSLMRQPVVFDTRGYWNREALEGFGFTYCLLGDGTPDVSVPLNREAAATAEA